MIGPADDELIHRALDGALSPEEAERFRARVAADPAFGARAERVERLAVAVDRLGPEEPPVGFSDRVMAEVASVSPPRPAWHRRLASLPGKIGHQLFPWSTHSSEQGNHSSEAFRRAGMAGGGVIVAKKALWGVAGLAVVVILAVVYFNGRTVDQGAQGAIGAADRYRGAQPGSVDAKPGNAQAFLQSDTFDKLIKNKDIRGLLGDPELCQLLTNDAVEKALKDEEVAAFFNDKKLMEALGDADVATALEAVEVQAFMADAEVQLALADDTVVAAFQTKLWEAAIQNHVTMKIFGDAEVQATLIKRDKLKLAKLFADAETAVKAHKFRGESAVKASEEAAVQKAGVHAALNNQLFAEMMADPTVQEALNHGSEMAIMLGDESFQQAVASGKVQAMMTDDNFQANMQAVARAFRNVRFQEAMKAHALALFVDVQFRAAMSDPDFMAVIGNRNFKAALDNQAGLQAELKKR
jgi:hypothetical protein